METKERVMKLIDALGLAKSEFERNCGLSNGYVNSMKNTIGTKGLEKILSRYPQVSKSWLIFGEGEMFDGDMDSPSGATPEDFHGDVETAPHSVTVGGNASNITNGSNDKTILFALNEVSEMRKLLAEVININKEQSQRLTKIVDKIADKI